MLTYSAFPFIWYATWQLSVKKDFWILVSPPLQGVRVVWAWVFEHWMVMLHIKWASSRQTCLRGFWQSKTQNSLPSYGQLEKWNFGWSKLDNYAFQIENNKGADQTARMRRLVCAIVFRKPPKTGFLMSRPKKSKYYDQTLYSRNYKVA